MALEDTHEAWTEDAIATIIGISLKHEQFTCDDVRREMRPAPHSNLYGGAFAAAKTLGHIEPVGDQSSESKSRRHGRLRTWRRAIVSKGVMK